MNVDLDAKIVFSNKLVDDLKCENESLKMHAKCLITETIAKKEENLCCNHVVLPDFVPIVSFTSKKKNCVHSFTQKKLKSGEKDS